MLTTSGRFSSSGRKSARRISRRRSLALVAGGLVAGAGAAVAPRRSQAAPSSEIPPAVNYQIFVDGDLSGSQHVDFVPRPQGFTATSHMSIRVEVMFVTAFRFHQIGDSDWHDGNPVGFEYITNNDGTPSSVLGKRDGDSWTITGPSGTQTGVGSASPPGFWNRDIVTATSVVDPEKGVVVPFSAVRLTETSTSIAGQTVTGEGYAINSFVVGQLWFAPDKSLAALIFDQQGHTVAVLKT
ncbi:MAG: hypothetical protein JO255_17590 [Alphaproteobacteria bacterium]|nr:hypothetical protein [Alphaproteobacteria bacterium]